MLRLLVDIRFQVLFHSPPGVLFTFPSRYYALSVHISISPWRVVPPASHKVSRVSWYSGYCPMLPASPTGLSPSLAQLPSCFDSQVTLVGSPQPRSGFPDRFGLCPVRSPLLGVSLFDSFSSGYLDVSVHRVPFLLTQDDSTTAAGFPHSDICGSKVTCTSPQLFAAYRVLLRLIWPRHPPYALTYLTFSFGTFVPTYLV